MRRSWLVAGVVALGAMVGLTTPAFAHATLQSTSPPSGGVVARSPGHVILHFDEQVAYQSNSVEVFDSAAKRVDTGSTHHPSGDSHAVEVAVPDSLPSGGYVVTWRVISADSHPVHGAFTFSVGAAAGSSLNGEAAQLLASRAGNTTVGLVFGVDRFLAFIAAALFLGGLFFLVVIWRPSEPRGGWLIWTGLVALVVTSVFAFALQGVYGAGLGLGSIVHTSVLTDVWHSHFGHVYCVRLILLVVAAVLTGPALRRRLLPVAAVVGVAILATWGLADHAGTGSLAVLAVPFDAVHLGAVSLWLGGLAIILLVVLPSGELWRPPVLRFSQWALGAIAAIAATGVFAAWRQVGVSWGALTTTPYGKLVIYKAVGAAAIVAVASISRRLVHGRLAVPLFASSVVATAPAPPAPPSAGTFRRAILAEVAIALAVLTFAAVLVETQPAKQAYAAPASFEVKAGPDLLDAVVDPAKAGPLVIHLYVLTSAGAVADIPEVRATMSNPGAGITGLAIPLSRAGPGHFLTSGFAVPIRGAWTINVVVRTTDVDEFNADPFTVHIR